MALPADVAAAGPVAILAVMMFLAPALGVPHEEMLQDTLKSIIVSFGALVAALLFFWQERQRTAPLRWHAVGWLPLLLMAYAAGSMAWSHTYLAAVETIRWFIFSLLVWLGANILARDRLPTLAWGIHAGAVVASLWAALQFWVNFGFFPQGPNPASTFVNRNFFAELAVCALPFSAMLLAQARSRARVGVLAATTSLVIVAVLMTGTRSALVAMWVELLLVLPVAGWLYRKQLPMGSWDRQTRILAAALLVGGVIGMGLIHTGNPKIVEETRGNNALERGFMRTASISTGTRDMSLGVRLIMWKATARMVKERPLTGVGAGAWESEIPLYQAEGSELETDYYVHNEFLQLLAEYGLAGWIFLLGLFAYLLRCAWLTLTRKDAEASEDAPWRAIFLCSLLALLIVSNAGFPWRMAATGALFALCLGGLAASDARLSVASILAVQRMDWRPYYSRAMAVFMVGCLALAAYITQLAAECEQKIVRATRIALSISASGNPTHPKWNKQKAEMLNLLREGIAINPHYRKITPMTADELAKWGDWKDATWIWESVLSSRPYVVAMLTNASRGYITMGNAAKATELLERAKKIQPHATAVRSLEVILLSRTGQEPRALEIARQAIADKVYDFDLLNAAFYLAWRGGDFDLAARAIQMRMEAWPQTRASGFIQLGNMYATPMKDPDRALAAFRQAMATVPETQRESLLPQIPPAFWPKLGFPNAVPPAPVPQTSASKG